MVKPSALNESTDGCCLAVGASVHWEGCVFVSSPVSLKIV